MLHYTLPSSCGVDVPVQQPEWFSGETYELGLRASEVNHSAAPKRCSRCHARSIVLTRDGICRLCAQEK